MKKILLTIFGILIIAATVHAATAGVPITVPSAGSANITLISDGTGRYTATTTPNFAAINATSTTASSTFAGGVDVLRLCKRGTTTCLGGLVDLTTGVTGVLPVPNGGTSNDAFNTDGVVYYDGEALLNSTGLTFTPTTGLTLSSGPLTVTANATSSFSATTTFAQDIYTKGHQLPLEDQLDQRISDFRRNNYQLSNALDLTYRDASTTIVSLNSGEQLPHGMIYARGYIWISTLTTPAKLIRVDPNNLSNRTTITYAADFSHDNAYDIFYSKTKDRIYVLFANPDKVVINEVNPVSMAQADVITDTTQQDPSLCGSYPCYFPGGSSGVESFTTDESSIYVLMRGEGVDSEVFKYNLSTYAFTASTTLTGLVSGHAIRYDGTNLYATGLAIPAWVAKINPSTLAFNSQIFTNGDSLATDDFAFAGDYVFIGLEGTNGTFIRVNKSNLGFNRYYSGINAATYVVFFDGRYIWYGYNTNPATLMRVDPFTMELRTFTTTMNSINEMVSDGQRFFATSFIDLPAKLTRFVVADLSTGQFTLATSSGSALLTITGTTTNFGNVGIGTSTPYSGLTVWGKGTSAKKIFELVNNASTTLESVQENGTTYFLGNIGIGTTSPYAVLSVVGATGVVADKYFATSTTATSTFSAGISTTKIGTTATSSMAGLTLLTQGLTISTLVGCNGNFVLETDANGGVTCGADASGAPSGTANTIAAFNGSGTLIATSSDLTVGSLRATSTTATSSIISFFSVGSTTPYGNSMFSIGTSTRQLFTVDKNTGFIGIATSTPGSQFAVGGGANISGVAQATSTFYGGINLLSSAGCFSVNGVCVGGGGGSGTVTSVTLATPNSTLSLGGTNPVTTSGTINADLNLAHANIWTALQTFTSASSTYLSASNELNVPHSADPFVPANGDCAWNTTTASSSLHCYDGTNENVIDAFYRPTWVFNLGSYKGAINPSSGSSTAMLLGFAPFKMSIVRMTCSTFGDGMYFQVGTTTPSNVNNPLKLEGKNATSTFTTFQSITWNYLEPIYGVVNATTTNWTDAVCLPVFRHIDD